jgi:heat shock protein HtpX
MSTEDTAWKLDTRRIQKTGILDGIVLTVSAWCGVLIATFFALLSVSVLSIAGIVFAGGVFFAGIFAVPLFGFLFAAIGMSRARDGVLRETRTQLLPLSHPLRQGVVDLAAKLDLPPPLVGIYPDNDINAFAAGSGPHKAAVSFSQGLVDRGEWHEIMAIAAHEVAHIANNDMRRLQRASSFQRAMTWYMAWWHRGREALAWVFATIGQLLVLRLSRQREYWADATAAALVGRENMIAALELLERDAVEPSAARLAYARMMIRANPRELLSTHPPLPKRIAALKSGEYMRKLPFRGAR